MAYQWDPYLEALNGGRHFVFIGKLVVAFMNVTSWSRLVGRVRQLERQTGEQKVPAGVVFVAYEHQATTVS